MSDILQVDESERNEEGEQNLVETQNIIVQEIVEIQEKDISGVNDEMETNNESLNEVITNVRQDERIAEKLEKSESSIDANFSESCQEIELKKNVYQESEVEISKNEDKTKVEHQEVSEENVICEVDVKLSTENDEVKKEKLLVEESDGEIIDDESEKETKKMEVDDVPPKKTNLKESFVGSDEGEISDSEENVDEKDVEEEREKAQKKNKDKRKHKSKHRKRSTSRSPTRQHRRSASRERSSSPLRHSSTREVHSNGQQRRYHTDKKRTDVQKDIYANPIILHNRCLQVIQVGENQAAQISDEELRTYIKESMALAKSMEKIREKRDKLKSEMQYILNTELEIIKKTHSELPRHMQNVLHIDGNVVHISDRSPYSSTFGMPGYFPPHGPKFGHPGMPSMSMPPPSFMGSIPPPQFGPPPPLGAPPLSFYNNFPMWKNGAPPSFMGPMAGPPPSMTGPPPPLMSGPPPSITGPPPSLFSAPEIRNNSYGSPQPPPIEVEKNNGKTTPPQPFNSHAFNKLPPGVAVGQGVPDFSKPPPRPENLVKSEATSQEGSPQKSQTAGFRSTTDPSNPQHHDISKNLTNMLTSVLKAHVIKKSTSASFSSQPSTSSPSTSSQPPAKQSVPSLMSVPLGREPPGFSGTSRLTSGQGQSRAIFGSRKRVMDDD